jgi:two-component system, OmpR family, phosphate regulon sensor histidine kinase PhoR
VIASLAGRAVLWFGLVVVVAFVLTIAVLALAGRAWGDVAAGFAVGGAVGAVTVWALARVFDARLQRTGNAVDRLARGDLSFRVHGRGAPGDLAEAVNRMAGELQARIGRMAEDRRTRDRILSAMVEGVILFRGDEVAYLNPAAGRVLRAEPTLVREVAPHALRRLVEEARGTGERREGEAETGLPPRVLRAAAVPLGGDQVLLVLRDITEARRVEAMRRDFVADASHELKTPVASIQASADTLLEAMDDQDEDAARRFAARLSREADRLSRIVSDLLDLSRLEARPPRLQPVRLDRVAREEAARVRDRAREGGVDLEVEAPAAVTVAGDPEGLTLLVDNLLDNALRYTDQGGRVRLTVVARGGRAVLTVADTGDGIPTRDLPRVFERFFRVDRARSRATGGTGLGLSIARHVAEQHGGRIDVESQLGRGSTFRVLLPLEEETGRTAGDPASGP